MAGIKKADRDLIGQKFNKLHVIDKSGNIHKKGYLWVCLCDCGNICEVLGSYLRTGKTKSCGCLLIETARINIIENRKSAVKPYGVAAFNQLYSRYKCQAQERGIPFNLSTEEFRQLTSQNCFLCGSEPAQTERSHGRAYNGNYVYNGIDRVDNNKGYQFDNCAPCCGKCNRSKRDDDLKYHIEWVLKSADYIRANRLDK